jgi:hypothetical protein
VVGAVGESVETDRRIIIAWNSSGSMSSAEERSRLASRGTGGRGRSWVGFGFGFGIERLDLADARLEATDDALD